MKDLLNPFWIIITVIISVVFGVLFYPAVVGEHGELKTILYTALGILVIWIVYFIRAYIFSNIFNNRKSEND